MRTVWSRLLVALSLVVILGGGMGIGVAVDRHWLRPRAERRAAPAHGERRHKDTEALIAHFKQQLDLRPEQERVVGAALREMRAELRTIRQRVAPELQVVRERARTKIRAVLDPGQQARYAKMVEAYDARRRKANQR